MVTRLFRSVTQHSLMVAMLVLLALFLLYPIWLTVWGAFDAGFQGGPGDLVGTIVKDPGSIVTLEHVSLVFKDPTTVQGLVNAGLIAVCTTTFAALLALPLAMLSARRRFPLRGVFNALILVPLILPPFVGAIGVRAIMGRAGALNALLGTDLDLLGSARFWGVVVVEALHLYPIIYLNAVAALANVDPALEEAAENVGIGPIRRFVRVTLPLIRPGLFAGATIVFIWSLTELGTPLVFDFTRVTPVQIFEGLQEVESSAAPYALTAVMLGASVLLYAVGRGLFGRRGHAMYAKASRASSERPMSVLGSLVAMGAFTVVTLLALVPHVGVVLTSLSDVGAWYRSVLPESFTLDHYRTALGDEQAFGSVVNSLKYASLAMLLDLGLGLLIGYLVVRTRLWGRSLLDALCMLPLGVPGLVLAFGFVAMTLRWPFASGDPLHGTLEVFGTDPNPLALIVIAYGVRRLPYIVRATAAGLEQTSGELEEAAINLGATRLTAVRRVIVPLIMANLLAGSLLVFSFSMLEVSDSLILAQQQEDYPITKAIYAFIGRLGDGAYIASAMGVWGMALLGVTLVGASLLIGRRLGSIFRV